MNFALKSSPTNTFSILAFTGRGRAATARQAIPIMASTTVSSQRANYSTRQRSQSFGGNGIVGHGQGQGLGHVLSPSANNTASSANRAFFNSTASLLQATALETLQPLRLLLIGSPGSGKGTQSTRIQECFEVNTISSGDLLRKNIALNTAVGIQAAKEMKNGAFVSDEVMVKLIDWELEKLGSDQSWLLDGFPRTMTQAKRLDQTLEKVRQPLNLVIHLNVPEEVILQRIMDRWVHIPSGRVYNMTYNPPKHAGLDDVTGEALSRRPDDNPETFKIRLQKHHELTEPLLDYYNSRDILVSLTGNTSDEIYPQINQLLQSRFVGSAARTAAAGTAHDSTDAPQSVRKIAL